MLVFATFPHQNELEHTKTRTLGHKNKNGNSNNDLNEPRKKERKKTRQYDIEQKLVH